jgi:hypothetical protein
MIRPAELRNRHDTVDNMATALVSGLAGTGRSQGNDLNGGCDVSVQDEQLVRKVRLSPAASRIEILRRFQ